MLWLEHISIGFVYHYLVPSRYTDAVVGSCSPDLFMFLFMFVLPLIGKPLDRISYPYTHIFYFLPHSLLVLPLVPSRLRMYYGLHILCDCANGP